MAAAPQMSDISNALGPLRVIVDSLKQAQDGQLPVGPERRKLVKCVKSAGNAALPTLLRALASTIEGESSWAYYLLARLGGEKVVQKVSSLLEDPEIEDAVKARALGLLSDLEAPVPQQVVLQDPEALLEKSVKELLASLDDDGEVAQAVDLILEQVPEAELPPFAAEVVRHGGRRAIPLFDALLLRHELADDTRQAIVELRRQATASRSEQAAAKTLDRGLEYLEAGKPKAARRRLERFVEAHPSHAEGRSALGVCLLQLGSHDEAMVHLSEASRLEPDEALHAWNLAAAAKQGDRMGGAYLALRDYLKLDDEGDGAAERTKEARSFVRAYERMLRDSHPGVSLAEYLRGEELFARAYAELTEGHPKQAVVGFEAVLALVPRHYPSWGNLGAAYLALDRKADAQRCLERALELNPEYTIARRNLDLL